MCTSVTFRENRSASLRMCAHMRWQPCGHASRHTLWKETSTRSLQHATCQSRPPANLSKITKTFTDTTAHRPTHQRLVTIGQWESGGCGRCHGVTPPYLGQKSQVFNWVRTWESNVHPICLSIFKMEKKKEKRPWLKRLSACLGMSSDIKLVFFNCKGLQSQIQVEKVLVLNLKLPHAETAVCASYASVKPGQKGRHDASFKGWLSWPGGHPGVLGLAHTHTHTRAGRHHNLLSGSFKGSDEKISLFKNTQVISNICYTC